MPSLALRIKIKDLAMSQLPFVAERAYAFWLAFGAIQPYAFTSDDCPIEAPQPSFFSAHPHHKLGAVLPDGCAVFTATSPEGNAALGKLMPQIITSQPCSWEIDGAVSYLVATDSDIKDFKRAIMPAGVGFKLPGEHVTLPSSHEWAETGHIKTWQSLPKVGGARLCEVTDTPIVNNIPLTRFSLRGQGAEFEARAIKAVPLLGKIVLSGQATAFFAPPNAGKTLVTIKLLLDAIAEGRLNPENVYYINADDNSAGFAAKLRLLEDAGAHVLAPGYRGFKASELVDHLNEIGRVKGGAQVLVAIDTLKKFTSLMSKDAVSEFAQACRVATMNGATIVGFGHTNKNTGESGKLRYGGTTDLIDDFDAAYLMTPLPDLTATGERVVRFESIKARGANARLTAYAYAGEDDVDYTERLASVREVDEAELETFVPELTASAIDLVPIIKACIAEGRFAKIPLAKEVAKRSGASERAAVRVINQHTGTSDPKRHLWHFERKAHGAHIFFLNDNGEEQVA